MEKLKHYAPETSQSCEVRTAPRLEPFTDSQARLCDLVYPFNVASTRVELFNF